MSTSKATAGDLMLRCASSRFDAEDRAGVEESLAQGVDWEQFLKTAKRHRLLPMVYDRLRGLDCALVPPAVVSHLERTFYTSVMRNEGLADELEQVVTALQQAGVAAIVLKGGALAWTVYASPGLRPMADLDLLVRPEQVTQAGAALESIGFCLAALAPDRIIPFQQRFGGGVEWRREGRDRTVPLDLQHHLVGVDWCRNAFRVDSEALWAAARPLAVRSAQAWQLSAEDMLIHLCLHPALHDGYAGPLMGYVDMDRVIVAAGSEAFWARLVERAARFRVRTVVYYGLLAAHRLLATPVPDEVLQALHPGSLRLAALQRLVPLDRETVIDRLGRYPAAARQLLLYSALMDRTRDAGGMVREILFPDEEWLAVRYSLESKAQVRRHRLTHPLRVARALARGLRRPLRRSGLE